MPRLPEPDSQAFWDAAGQHRLTYRRCRSCGAAVFFVRAHCPRCGSFDVDDEVSNGLGTIYSCTVVRRDGQPGFRDRTPYVTALVDLDEGFRILTEIATDDVDAVRIGQRVEVTWEDHDEGAIALFRPVDAAP
jgi:uncharacterized OB-fold protein